MSNPNNNNNNNPPSQPFSSGLIATWPGMTFPDHLPPLPEERRMFPYGITPEMLAHLPHPDFGTGHSSNPPASAPAEVGAGAGQFQPQPQPPPPTFGCNVPPPQVQPNPTAQAMPTSMPMPNQSFPTGPQSGFPPGPPAKYKHPSPLPGWALGAPPRPPPAQGSNVPYSYPYPHPPSFFGPPFYRPG